MKVTRIYTDNRFICELYYPTHMQSNEEERMKIKALNCVIRMNIGIITLDIRLQVYERIL